VHKGRPHRGGQPKEDRCGRERGSEAMRTSAARPKTGVKWPKKSGNRQGNGQKRA